MVDTIRFERISYSSMAEERGKTSVTLKNVSRLGGGGFGLTFRVPSQNGFPLKGVLKVYKGNPYRCNRGEDYRPQAAIRSDWTRFLQEYETLDRLGGLKDEQQEGHAPIALAKGFVVETTENDMLLIRPAFLMEDVEGPATMSLNEAMSQRARPFSANEIATFGLRVLDVLVLQKRYNVVHRDLSPNNIFVRRTSDGAAFDKVIFIDYGQGAEPDRGVTPGNPRLAQLSYCAPEMLPDWEGNDDLGSSHHYHYLLRNEITVDLWSLGAIMYQMATGERPFYSVCYGEDGFYQNGRLLNLPEAARILVEEKRDRKLELPSGLGTPKQLCEAIVCCTMYDPRERHIEVVRSLLEEVARSYDNAFQPLPSPAPQSTPAPCRSDAPVTDSEDLDESIVDIESLEKVPGNSVRRRFAVIALIVIAAIVGFFVVAYLGTNMRGAEQPAEEEHDFAPTENHESASTWGPEDRMTFTWDSPANYITFNSMTNNPDLGDERNFVRIREAGTNDALTDSITVVPGKTYELYIYYHNNASSNLNESGETLAQNVTLSVSYPSLVNVGDSASVTGTLSSTNASPEDVWDTVSLTVEESVCLAYVPDSAVVHNAGSADKSILDAESLFSDNGAFIAYSNNYWGTIPGGSEYAGYITLELEAKRVPLEGSSWVWTEEGWAERTASNPGDVLDMCLVYVNQSGRTQTSVTAYDTLSDYLKPVSGSIRLIDEAHPEGTALSDKLFDEGIVIGDYEDGQRADICYQIRVSEDAPLNETVYNNALVATEDGSVHDKVAITFGKPAE